METNPTSGISEIVARSFTSLQLFEKAALFKGLNWNQTELPVKVIEIGKISCLVAALPPEDIAIEVLSDNYSIGFKFAGIGETNQEWWVGGVTEKIEENPIEFTFFISLNIDENKKGVELKPIIHTNQNWPSRTSFHEQLLRILYSVPDLTEKIKAIPAMTEIAEAESTLIITWEQLGLAGIVSIYELFEQFCGQNGLLQRLVRSNLNPFDPRPVTIEGGQADLWFMPDEAVDLLKTWRRQLDEHVHSLGI